MRRSAEASPSREPGSPGRFALSRDAASPAFITGEDYIPVWRQAFVSARSEMVDWRLEIGIDDTEVVPPPAERTGTEDCRYVDRSFPVFAEEKGQPRAE